MNQLTQKHFCSLSEAIREGSKMSAQCFGEWSDGDGTCALGAAAEAVAGRDFEHGIDLAEFWPYINEVEAPCPVCEVRFYLCGAVMHLNDHHRWTREAIADWLESEEEKLGFVTVVEGESSRSQTEVSDVVMV